MPHPSAHGTLVATVVSTVTLTVPQNTVDPVLVVANRSADQDIWFTIDGSAPAVASAGSLWVGAGKERTMDMSARRSVTPGSYEVKLISAGAPTFTVQVL